ncbi:hypothetical protein EXE58_14120 [Nocardioides seonyuensis]|uniref:Uncharacterized protein n=1 Tax=Nocardioides seonyuensis TaxID=2518371 RepID=A0A4P7IGN2_9ACTN|nr:hypothetical protein [Nocardioides seonyuensis]QBX56489.1 hypothetical protein EXE58_14120 [Nocardioides seonyuensis]
MGDQQDTWRWRPEPAWLGLSFLGLIAGALIGAAYVVAMVLANFNVAGTLNGDAGGTLMGLLGLAVLGAVYGAAAGLTGGAAVGLVLTFLVGRGMSGRAAPVLTFFGAALTVALLLWSVVPRVFDTTPSDSVLVMPVSAAAVGLVALWFRHQLSPAAPGA